MYNKFRAVSSIQVILEICIPILAILGLSAYLNANKEVQWDSIKKSAGITLGLLILLLVGKGMFNFTSPNDPYLIDYLNSIVGDQSFGYGFMDALREDRAAMYSSDLVRSLLFVLFTAIILIGIKKDKIKANVAVILIGILMVADLFTVSKNYVNEESFVESYKMETPFQATTIDQLIARDTTHYRVFELQGAMSNARTSYFHKSIGGYSAVKPKRIQELYDYHITNGNQEILNMLNVKYIISTDEQGSPAPMKNDNIYGNAWFVSDLKLVNSADEEIKALDSLNQNIAIINKKEFSIENTKLEGNTLSSISLVKYKPNYLKYKSTNINDGLAVFSEIYYPKGWIATIDGKEAKILRANYTLRALEIPKGEHIIEFKFEPEVVKKGSTIALISSIVMLLIIGLGIYWKTKK